MPRFEELKISMAPIAPNDARLFILGSLPGDASLAAQRYYAHPRNLFWKLLGGVVGDDLQAMPYDQRLDRLAEQRIGLWDVVGSATRRGSLDQAIRTPEHNRIERLIDEYPALEAIGFNGTTAAAIGRRLLGECRGTVLIDLPSSSPANTRPFAEKAAAWSQLKPYCGPRTCPNA